MYKPVALPYQEFAPWKTPYDREVAAWTRMTQTITMGTAIGAIVGAVGAGLVGCVLGGVVRRGRRLRRSDSDRGGAGPVLAPWWAA